MTDAARQPVNRSVGLLVTGLVAWATVLAAGIAGIPSTVGSHVDPHAAAWLAVVVLFGLELVISSLVRARSPGWLNVARVLGASALALLANWLVPLPIPGVAIGGVLLVVVAARAAASPLRQWSWALVAMQTAALGAVYAGSGWPATTAWIAAMAFGAFQVLALVMGFLAESERRAREELALSLAALRSTQSLLADAATQAERHRIDRELHDVLGHHLTALSLQLQRAAALSTGEPAELVTRAHHLTRLVLADVRSVVSEPAPPVDLAAAVNAMRDNLPGVSLMLEGGEALADLPSPVAHALLRCVQEAATNAVRHGEATALRVRAERSAAGVRVSVADNGRGLDRSRRGGGSGLNGLRERLAPLGGRLEVRAGDEGGVELSVSVPLMAEAYR